MGPARLAEIETAWTDWSPHDGYTDPRTHILELISSLRDAWRERDRWKDEDWLRKIGEELSERGLDRNELRVVKELIEAVGIARWNFEGQLARADRAEAEVERLRIELGEIKLVLDSQDMRLHRYHAVREAAEAYLTSTERCSNEFMSSAQDAAWKTAEENLRCILDACAQDPAR